MLENLSALILSIIETTGYAGVFFLMAIESANIPVPSEIIMPFAGFLASQKSLSFWPVVFWGALGNLAGSLVSYYIAYFGRKRAVNFLIKIKILRESDLDLSIKVFQKYGRSTAFFSRLLPVIRTFISFPAGLFKSDVRKFSLYTFAGSFFWSAILTYLGFIAGENWPALKVYFHKFDWLIAVILILAAAWWFKHRFFNGKIDKSVTKE